MPGTSGDKRAASRLYYFQSGLKRIFDQTTHTVDKQPGVGMAGSRQNHVGWANFYQATCEHHTDPISNLSCQTDVVGNKKHGQTQFNLEI